LKALVVGVIGPIPRSILPFLAAHGQLGGTLIEIVPNCAELVALIGPKFFLESCGQFCYFRIPEEQRISGGEGRRITEAEKQCDHLLPSAQCFYL
jgi:hypothetical protein